VPDPESRFVASVVDRKAGTPTWAIAELDDNASPRHTRRFTHDMDIDCPAATPSPRGYLLSWMNGNGAFLAEYDVAKNVATSILVASVVNFGGPSQLPVLAGSAAAGRDFVLAFSRPRGPEVWRFDVFGHKVGSPLVLPAAGGAGPVATWPGPGAFWATYVTPAPATPDDRSGNPSSAQRQWVKVQCPGPPLAAAADAGPPSAPRPDADGEK
jgi:hypothetical protein